MKLHRISTNDLDGGIRNTTIFLNPSVGQRLCKGSLVSLLIRIISLNDLWASNSRIATHTLNAVLNGIKEFFTSCDLVPSNIWTQELIEEMRSTYLAIDCGLWATIAGRQSQQQDGEYAIEMVHCEEVKSAEGEER